MSAVRAHLQFPMWIYYAALPVGGLLMTVRYLIRLYRYVFRFDPATMTVGHIPAHDLPDQSRPRWQTTEPCGPRCSWRCFSACFSAGMPIFLVLGACAAVLYVVSGQPLIGMAQVIIDHLNSSTLMSLPLFVMAAAFMRQGGVAKALVDVSAAWLGGIRGSLGLVTVVACTLFAAICGSSVATALAMGTILLPAMIEKGYPRSFALGVIGASGTIGIVIPSLALILYGIVAEQSVPRLFLAGILPGLLQAATFFAWVWYDARRRNFPKEPALPLADRLRVTVRALPALLVPVVVLVGIYGGFVTVTEAAAIAAVRRPGREPHISIVAFASPRRCGWSPTHCEVPAPLC